MVIAAKLIGIVLLSLVVTQVFMIMFLGSLERFTIWLYTRHPMKMARLRELLQLSSQDTTKPRSKGRQDSKYEEWSIECFEKAYQWVHACERGISSLIRKTNINTNGDYQKKTHPNEYPDTVKVGLLHLSHIGDRTNPIFSRWHIGNIVGRLKRAVNHSGKEPRGGFFSTLVDIPKPLME